MESEEGCLASDEGVNGFLATVIAAHGRTAFCWVGDPRRFTPPALWETCCACECSSRVTKDFHWEKVPIHPLGEILFLGLASLGLGFKFYRSQEPVFTERVCFTRALFSGVFSSPISSQKFVWFAGEEESLGSVSLWCTVLSCCECRLMGVGWRARQGGRD